MSLSYEDSPWHDMALSHSRSQGFIRRWTAFTKVVGTLGYLTIISVNFTVDIFKGVEYTERESEIGYNCVKNSCNYLVFLFF